MHDTTQMNCISTCLECYRTCTEMASDHCLERGGPHVEPKHFRTMLACAEICGTSAQMTMLQSPYHYPLCMLCARICEDCADSCRDLEGMEPVLRHAAPYHAAKWQFIIRDKAMFSKRPFLRYPMDSVGIHSENQCHCDGARLQLRG